MITTTPVSLSIKQIGFERVGIFKSETGGMLAIDIRYLSAGKNINDVN